MTGWLAGVVFAAVIAAAPPGLAKVAVPIEGQLTPERVRADVGTTVTFRLEVSTTRALDRIVVRLKVPDGMSLVDGTASAEIANPIPGERHVFEYRLRLDQPGEMKVWAEAEVLGIAPAVMRQVFLSVVNPVDDRKEKPTIRRDPDGATHEVHGISIKKSQ
jgi:uncharacterized protein (DUF58 family)